MYNNGHGQVSRIEILEYVEGLCTDFVFNPLLTYRGFHEKGTFSVHSFNDDYLSIPERPGSYKYLFHEIPVI